MEKKFRSKLDEVTLRMEEMEVQMDSVRQNSEKEKQEKEELKEKLSAFEEKLKKESEGKQNVEKRIQSLETKSDSFASKLSLFENLSKTEGREKHQGPSSSLWGEDSRTGRDSVTSILTSSSSGYESFTDSHSEQHDSVPGARAKDQSTRSQLKTAGGGREPVIVLASDGIAAERCGGRLGQ